MGRQRLRLRRWRFACAPPFRASRTGGYAGCRYGVLSRCHDPGVAVDERPGWALTRRPSANSHPRRCPLPRKLDDRIGRALAFERFRIAVIASGTSGQKRTEISKNTGRFCIALHLARLSEGEPPSGLAGAPRHGLAQTPPTA